MNQNRNILMHPRNIYKVPPDYTELAIKYPEFRKICTLQLDGKVSINLKIENTLKILSQTLLLNDFQLNVKFPENCLIPTIPLRLNYILWIEDILNEFNLKQIHGIDIGCGAVCIYSLLAAKKNGWQMTGIETQLDSIQFANENILNNNLNNLIDIFHQKNNDEIFKNFFEEIPNSNDDQINKQYDFCICNPPFYDSQQFGNFILPKNNRKRKAPNNLATGNKDELLFSGGEEAFVTKIITDSLQYKNDIKIYSSMLGHKKTVNKILKTFDKENITNFIQTEFCQGKTTRWGIAWSFDKKYNMELCRKYSIGNKISLNEDN